MTTHAFRHEKRKQLTDQQRAKLFLDREGKCHRCTRKIRPGEIWYDEHLNALETGGTNDWSNRYLTCAWCFPKKNAEDHAKAAKIRAVATKHIVHASQRQRKSPPIPGSKRSAWKRKMDGSLVPRYGAVEEADE